MLAEGLLGGSYAWKIQMSVLMTYLRPPQYDVATQRADPLVLTVLIQRQPLLQSYKARNYSNCRKVCGGAVSQPEQAPTIPASS